jgi:hypothetical protein
MTDSTHLERRYRRMLAFYPKAFRQEREQEILSVLMSGAAEGQRRPRSAGSGSPDAIHVGYTRYSDV